MKANKRKRRTLDQALLLDATVATPTTSSVPSAASPSLAAANSTYRLASTCTMREITTLKAELMQLLKTEQPVLLDVSQVERIDTAAMQLLCAFVRDRRARRLTTSWTGESQAFVEAIITLGLSQALNYTPKVRAV